MTEPEAEDQRTYDNLLNGLGRYVGEQAKFPQRLHR